MSKQIFKYAVALTIYYIYAVNKEIKITSATKYPGKKVLKLCVHQNVWNNQKKSLPNLVSIFVLLERRSRPLYILTMPFFTDVNR